MDIFYDITAAPPRPPKESFNHVMDVRPLQFMLLMMTKLLGIHFTRPTHFRRDNVERDLVHYRHRVAEALSKAALHNFKTRLKWSMLRDGRWRAQVRGGLGGASALSCWRMRDEKYKARKAAYAAAHDMTPLPAPDYAGQMQALQHGDVALAPAMKPVPTDESGWFRLAPLGRVMRPRAELSEGDIIIRSDVRNLRAQMRRDLWDGMTFEEKTARPYVCRKETLHDIGPPEDWVFEIRPIPVTPDELGAAEGPGAPPREPDVLPKAPLFRLNTYSEMFDGEAPPDKRGAKVPP